MASSWSLGVCGLLGDQSDTSLLALSWENTNGLVSSISICTLHGYVEFRSVVSISAYLVVDESSVLAGVNVLQVQWVAGQLGSATRGSLDEERVAVAYQNKTN